MTNGVGVALSAFLALTLAMFWPPTSAAASESQAVSGDESRDETAGESTQALQVEGISASLGEDDPRVLFILPWQTPSLPKRPRAELDDRAPELIEPEGPLVLERHRLFRENLNPLILSPFRAGIGEGQSGHDASVTQQ